MRSLVLHGVLALGGLIMAWNVWTEEATEEVSPDAVELFECGESLEAIRLLGERRDTVLEAREEDGRPYYWIRIERRPDRADPVVKEFVGGEAVDELVLKLEPLRAERSLGVLDDEKLEELELDGEGQRLRIECGSRSVEWRVGATTFGQPLRYLRDPESGIVFLADSSLISELEAAEHRLMQRELLRLDMTEVETLHVRAFGEEQTLKQANRHDAARAQWVDAADPDRRNDLYGNWLNRFARLTVQEYLAVDAEPGADLEDASASYETLVEMEYRDEEGEVLDTLQLARVDAEQPQYYARTGATRSWVKVIRSVSQQIEDEARPVVGLEPIERPTPPEESPRGSAPVSPEGAAVPAEGALAPTEGSPTVPVPAPRTPPVPAPRTPPALPAPGGGSHGG